VLFETTGAEETLAKAAMTPDTLTTAQRLVRRLPVGDSVIEAILTLVRSSRPGPEGRRSSQADRLGPGSARQSVLDARRAQPAR